MNKLELKLLKLTRVINGECNPFSRYRGIPHGDERLQAYINQYNKLDKRYEKAFGYRFSPLLVDNEVEVKVK
jgi:hypothetical protein